MSSPQNPLDPDEYARLTGFDGKWRDTWWRKDFLALIANRCELTGPQKILDVGCGVGHWGRTLMQVLDPNSSLYGIDIEEKFVERSNGIALQLNLKSEYVVGAAEAIPYENNTFDLVTCQTVLIHVNDANLVLNEMFRVLKPGGTLLLAEPNNITGFLNSVMAEPRPEWHVLLKFIDFYHSCLRGKKKLGLGDSSIGEQLPLLIKKIGFTGIQIALNENCASLIPPYDSENQKIEIEFLKSCIKSNSWLGFGPRQNALKFYIAATGNEIGFGQLWELAMDYQKKILTALASDEYGGGRASLMYLISAKK